MAKTWLYDASETRWERRGQEWPGPLPVIIETYDQPTGATDPGGWEVIIEGSNTWVYPFSFGSGVTNRTAKFSTDAAAPINITVINPDDVVSAEVKPDSAGITANITGQKEVQFTLPTGFWGNLVVEINGISSPLFLAVLPLEGAVDPNDYGGAYPAGNYFGPGVYTTDTISLNSNDKLYVHGGALIKGKLKIGSANSQSDATSSNINVLGRGIVDSKLISDPGRPVRINKCSNVSVSGLTFIGEVHWGVVSFISDTLNFSYLQIFNSKNNADFGTPDGFDLVGCSNVTLTNSAIRAYDDAMTVKCSKYGWSGSCADITYSNMVIIQGDGGNAMEVGYENDTGFRMDRLKFQNIDVIRKTARPDPYRRAAIGFHATGPSPIDDVLWQDIRIESTAENNLWCKSFYATDYPFPNRAPVSNLVFRRVEWPTNALPFVIGSDDPNVPMNSVVFDSCTQGGTLITDASNMTVTNVNNLSFTGGP